MTNKKTYFTNRHSYMNLDSDIFAQYIFNKISAVMKLNHDTAYEFGAGMGRFTSPLIAEFDKIHIIEPLEEYVKIINEKFKHSKNVHIYKSTIEQFLNNNDLMENSYVFCFHVLHHLSREGRLILFESIKKTNSIGIFIEPNPFNPLFLLQIFFSKDMTMSEEYQYLLLNKFRYRKELNRNGLDFFCHKYICPYPPKIVELLLSRNMIKTLLLGEQYLAKLLPIVNSYQMIICG